MPWHEMIVVVVPHLPRFWVALPLTSISACLTCEGQRARDQTTALQQNPFSGDHMAPLPRHVGVGVGVGMSQSVSAHETRIANGTAAATATGTTAVDGELAALLESVQIRTPPRAAAATSALREQYSTQFAQGTPNANANTNTNTNTNPFQMHSLQYPTSQIPQFANSNPNSGTAPMASSFHDRLMSPPSTLVPPPSSTSAARRRANPTAACVPHFGHNTPRHNRTALSQRTVFFTCVACFNVILPPIGFLLYPFSLAPYVYCVYCTCIVLSCVDFDVRLECE